MTSFRKENVHRFVHHTWVKLHFNFRVKELFEMDRVRIRGWVISNAYESPHKDRNRRICVYACVCVCVCVHMRACVSLCVQVRMCVEQN